MTGSVLSTVVVMSWKRSLRWTAAISSDRVAMSLEAWPTHVESTCV